MREESEIALQAPVWRLGRICQVNLSADGKARRAVVEYKVGDGQAFKTTDRAVRRLVVLHREGDLEITQQLNEAARRADRQMVV